jgi:hypothetical protein
MKPSNDAKTDIVFTNENSSCLIAHRWRLIETARPRHFQVTGSGRSLSVRQDSCMSLYQRVTQDTTNYLV